MTPLWHGYPQHPDSHPERPWWRRGMVREHRRSSTGAGSVSTTLDVMGFVRSDGRTSVDEAGMRQVDADEPLPPPPPLVGQVWRQPDGTEVMVALHNPGNRDWFGPGPPPWEEWPPPGAVLVAGPLAPWAP